MVPPFSLAVANFTIPATFSMTLTKSEYLLFLKHRAWLWLKKYDRAKLPPVDANTQAIFDAGNKLEDYAEKLFPGATRLGFENYNEYTTLAQRTKKAISEGAKVLFQARFDAGNLICLTDVVEFTSPKSLNLYEIKSSTKPKDEHEYDLAFQCEVLQGAGYTVEKVFVMHVNREYVRQGVIDPSQLLTTVDISEKVRAKAELTKQHIQDAFRVMESQTIPDISPRFCRLQSLQDWLPIFRSLREVPECSIYDLASIDAKLVGLLEDQEIQYLKEIPDSIPLSEKQLRQVQAVKNATHAVQKENIKKFLDSLEYPLYFFDYETCADVIPPYDGVRPYQQVPSQYSLHIVECPGGDVRHTEYIHRTPDHPGEALSAALQKDIGPTGSVIVWYAPFETGRNAELGELLTSYTDFFLNLNGRVVDLMLPFSEGMYVDPKFMGSASIKKVLPVLVPELSYKKLAVQEGLTAQRLWMEAVLQGKGSPTEQEQLFSDLLTYCELDTFAMVKIYEKLLQIIQD